MGTFPGAGIPSSAGCRGAAAAVLVHYAHVRGPVLHAAKGLARGGSREGGKKGRTAGLTRLWRPGGKRGHCMAWHALTYITYASPMRRDVGRWVVEGCCCYRCWLATGSIQWVCWNVVQRREGRERETVLQCPTRNAALAKDHGRSGFFCSSRSGKQMNDICEQSSDRNGHFLILVFCVDRSILLLLFSFFFAHRFFSRGVHRLRRFRQLGSPDSLSFLFGLGNTTAREKRAG